MHLIKASFLAIVATLFCIWLLRPLAIHIGFVDRPGGRKNHAHSVPLIGGIALFFGFCFALLTLHLSLAPYRGLIAGGALLILMGVVDDFRELSSRLRLIGHIMSALLLVNWGHQSIDQLGNLLSFGDIQLGVWSMPFTVVAVVGFINAINMVDGQDGLAGSVVLGQIILLMLLTFELSLFIDLAILVMLASAIIAFLLFNMPITKNRKSMIFLGDSGSTFIAFVVAWFAIHCSQINIEVVKPMTLLWIIAFPIYDLFSVSIYRLKRGKSPFRASRDHIHHVLHLLGFKTLLSTMFLTTISLSLGVLGIILNRYTIADSLQLLLWLVMLVCYLWLVRISRSRANNYS